MFDLRRGRAAVGMLAALLAGVLLLNAAVAATVGPPKRWFPSDEDHYDWYFLERSASQFAAARRAAERDGVRVAVMLGLSTAACATDGDRLADDGPPGYRWIIANGFGGTVHKIAAFARLLAASGLRPGLVVVGINPLMLSSGRSHAVPPPPGAGAEAEADDGGGRLRVVKRLIRDHLWVVESRFHVKHLARSAALSLKIHLLERLGADPGAAVAPAAMPWERIEERLEGAMTPAEEARMRKGFTEGRVYQSSSYNADSAPARELVEVIRHARSTGARVVVVLLPEMGVLRREVPAFAHTLPARVLASAFGGDAPPVLDLSATVPDDLFFNFTHANHRGTAVFTPILGRALRDATR